MLRGGRPRGCSLPPSARPPPGATRAPPGTPQGFRSREPAPEGARGREGEGRGAAPPPSTPAGAGATRSPTPPFRDVGPSWPRGAAPSLAASCPQRRRNRGRGGSIAPPPAPPNPTRTPAPAPGLGVLAGGGRCEGSGEGLGSSRGGSWRGLGQKGWEARPEHGEVQQHGDTELVTVCPQGEGAVGERG